MSTTLGRSALKSDGGGEPTTPGRIPSTNRNRDFRPDIEGLRAIAIVLIVGYHAGVPGFSGGFVGVDVFFVISGFLITRLLLRDSAAAGSVPFSEFWARRIRRLVPGLALMVVATLLASLVIINPFDMLETAKEGAASALYVSNLLFAQISQNYFASNPNKSPFLHTWSLGVEEQFYVIWPFLVAGLLLLCRRSRRMMNRSALILFAAIFAVSFALNVLWTNAGSSWAFFSLPTRAWEFAAGGFLGSLTILRSQHKYVLAASGFAGLAILVVVAETFNSSTTFPGTNALYPVLGTMLLIIAGGGNPDNSPVSRLLSVRPMQWTGRLSYSWYLWHWPFIVLTVIALNTNATLPKTAAALASLGVAAAAFHLVENPIRYARSLRRPAYKTYLVGLAITAGALGIAGGTWLISSDRTPSSFNKLESVADRNFIPKCQLLETPGGAAYCYGGELSSTRTVALVGDSHVSTWFNEVSNVAARDKARVLLVSIPGCPFIAVEVRPGATNGPLGDRCSIERASAMSFLTKARPTSVVLAEHTGLYLGYILDSSGVVPSQSEQTALWQKAFKSFIQNELASGAKVGVILDNPVLPQSPAECVSQTASISECEPSRTVALAPDRMLGQAELQTLNRLSNVPYFSPDGVLCNDNGCPLEIQGQIMYADDNHLTDAATKLFSSQVSSLLGSLLDEHH